MTRRTSQQSRPLSAWLLAGAYVLLGLSVPTAAAFRQTPQTPKPPSSPSGSTSPAKPGSDVIAIQDEEELAKVGEATVEKTCNTQCHGLENLDSRRTAREWNDLLAEMVSKGAAANEKQLAIIKQYLKRYYGIVSINTAPAEELSAVLGFTAKDAQAIVEYRTANGKFADVDALSKVPGIDKTKIDEQPDAIRFK